MVNIGGFRGWLKGALGGPFWFLLGLCVVGGGAVYALDGRAGLTAALAEEGAILANVAPRIGAAMLLAALVQVLLPRDHVARWIGARSGWRGLVIASVVGAVTPGGPMTSFPVVAALYAAGADRGALIAYVTSWALLGMQRVLIWEAPFLGKDFVVMRLAVSWCLPLLAGMLARALPWPIDPSRESPKP